MLKIDVFILSNNEEGVIEDAVRSVRSWAENVFVVDAGSSDKTVDIAKRNGAKILEHKFRDFSDQRNFAITKAESPWVFYLDADERATVGFKEELFRKIDNEKSNDVAGFSVRRKTYYLGKDWGFSDEAGRVFNVSRFKRWEGVIHETAKVNGVMKKINSPILHFTHRSLEKMVEKTNSWSGYEAKLRHNTDHPPMSEWRFIRVMMTAFLRSFIKEKGYKNGTEGLIESIYQAFSMFITYAKLWELQKKKKD